MTVVVARPQRRATDVVTLALTRDGRLPGRETFDRLRTAASVATDCFVFCPGWLADEVDARQASARFFALLDAVLAPLHERIRPLRVAVLWPSTPCADPALARVPDEGLWPALERRMNGAARGPEFAALLVDLCRAEVPASPEEEEEAELDLLRHRLDAAGSRDAGPYQALSFWAMKRRAHEVGERCMALSGHLSTEVESS